MNIVKNIKSLDEIHDSLFPLNKETANIQTEIDCGGRKFKSQILGKFILNDLLKQLLLVTKNVQPSAQVNKKVSEIVVEIKKIDKAGHEALLKKNILLIIVTRICQFLGNFSFKRKEVLKNLEKVFIPLLENEAKIKLETKVVEENKNPVNLQNDQLQIPPIPLPQDLSQKTVEEKNDDLRDISLKLTKQGNVEKALEVAKTIPDDTEKNFALSDISLTLTKQGNFEKAAEVANQINDDSLKHYVLGSISKALAQKENFEKA
jgi:hypothetical protein